MVDRNKLLYVLLQNGVHGTFFRIAVNIYSNIRAAVSIEHGLKITDSFLSTCGVEQGSSLSTELFII